MQRSVDGSPEAVDLKAPARRVLFAIAGFMLLYLVLVAVAVGLLIASFYVAAGLVMLRISFITLAAAAGVLALGVMFFVFMIKFVFSRHRVEEPVRIELSPAEQPELFSMIHGLADAVQAPRPKHVYLVPEVNASVSYDSTFWSMFLPVRKNLRIGLGLTNVLNVSDLRAVLAHEFGHFSQRSMKVGSYVYTVNHTIHDLVAHRDSWDRTLEGWAETGGVFGFFAVITSHLVQQVRRLLAWAYGGINRAYSGLSREMEFHADSIAATVAGGPHLIGALHKAEYGGATWEMTLGSMGQAMGKGRSTQDLYTMHEVQTRHARRAVPGGSAHFMDGIQKERITVPARLVIKDQWASHPSLADRDERSGRIGQDIAADTRPAWALFRDAQDLRQRMTLAMYANSEADTRKLEPLTGTAFHEQLQQETALYHVDDRFNGFYDQRAPHIEHPPAAVPGSATPATIYSTENVDRIRLFHRTEQDHATLLAIKEGGTGIRSFDLDGRKYNVKEIQTCLDALGRDIDNDRKWLRELDGLDQAMNRSLAQGVGKEEHYLEKLAEVKDRQDRSAIALRIVELGTAVHAKLTSKPRFQQDEWRSIGRDAEQFIGQMRHSLETHPVHHIPDLIEDKDSMKVIEAVLRHTAPMPEFDADYFMRVLGAAIAVRDACAKAARSSLKELTDLQLTWVDGLSSHG